MKSFHRLIVPVAALLWLAVLLSAAGLLAACGGQTQEPGPGDAGQTETETAATTPAVQPAATEPAASAAPGESSLPTATEAPEAQTGVQPVSPIPIEITPLEPAPLTGEVPQDLLQAVIEDLLGRLDASRDAIARDRIAVEEAGAVVWRDGSLGCPQPGMMYTQALVPGFQIVLRVSEETYDYHASEAGYFVLCEGSLAESLLPRPTTTGDSSLPIFVEMVVTPLEPDLSPQMPPADTNPSGVYFFNPADRTLLVSPAIRVLPSAEVLVGLSSSTVPGKPYVASDLYQLPATELVPIRVIAIDADTDTVTLAYANQSFELGPGESKSLKQGTPEEPTLLQMITITNYGRLEGLNLLSPDPSSP